MQKQGTSDSELLNQAMAIAVEQRLASLSDANDVAHSIVKLAPQLQTYQVSRIGRESLALFS